jgi:CheY-like chemotaxis protein
MMAPNGPLNIVLIEDNKSDANITREILNDTGIEHRFIWLSDGEKAMQYFESDNAVDFILLDLNLPKVSGHRLMEFLKERGFLSETPLIILTGSTSPYDMANAKENGVVCYLIKPMTLEEMEQMTRTLREILLGQRSCNC